MTMAESNKFAASCQTKDLLSAALGQSGLHFEQSEDDSIQDVFAALAAGGDFLSDGPRPQTIQNPSCSEAGSSLQSTTDTYDNELQELMTLLDNGMTKYPQNQPYVEVKDKNASVRPTAYTRPIAATVKSKGNDTLNPILILDELNEPRDDHVIKNYESYKKSKKVQMINLADKDDFGNNERNSSDRNTRMFPCDNETAFDPERGIASLISKQRNGNPFLKQSAFDNDDSKEMGQAEEDEEEEEEDLGHADTFAEYMPAKVRIGKQHPDPVVETSSMASVAPPDVWYTLSLPEDIPDNKLLSALQLEAVIYSCQQHEKILPNGRRAGFLIGDGAGVGKGRTVAGIIYENYILGRKKAIWLSVSNDLRFDAIRDLRDIGCNVPVNALNKFKYDEKISSKANGKVKKGVIFSTYSSLIGETQGKARFKSRLSQLLHWCGEDFDGVIIFDECHKAKNLVPTTSGKPTKTGQSVVQLQNLLPKSRIVYCSATGASEPRNMAYMNRLGIWGAGTPFREFMDFIQSVEKRGVGAMEMVAMDMKLRGMYIARQLSFAGTSFNVQVIALNHNFIEMYNASVKLWADAREKFEKAADLLVLDGSARKTMWGQFWSAHQRFFKYLCIAAKVQEVVKVAKEAVDNGKCVVIGLQSTGEARTMEQLDELGGGDLNDFVSTAKGVLSNLIEKQFPVAGSSKYADKSSNKNDWRMGSPSQERKRKQAWRDPVRRKRRKEENVESTMVDSDSESNLDSFKDTDEASQEDVSDGDEQGNSSASQSNNSGSDEDNWLKALSDKPKTKKIKKKKPAPTPPSDVSQYSMSVLDAAGLTGRQFSWARSVSADSQPFKSNRTAKTNSSFDLSRQVSTSSPIPSVLPAAEQCSLMKNDLIEKVELVAPYFPPNTLDELIDELGGPDHVAEMTGRKARILAKEDGSFAYESRSKDDVPLELLNIAEKERFMSGEKFVAVISEAASSGISLQADRRVKNQRRRLHITLELPWSADKAIQQFGRTHRSNQISAPEYLFMISELAGEQRFASIVAKRLECLGALTHGDRRAADSRDLSRFNFDTKYGRSALEVVLKSLIGVEKPLVAFPESYKSNFLDDVCDGLIGVGMLTRGPQNSLNFSEKDYSKVARFLNRILGLSVASQNALFTYFTDTMNSIIREAKRSGRWDEGILDLGSQGESVKKLDVRSFSCPSSCGLVTTDLLTVSVERGLSWEKAYEIFTNCSFKEEGFYCSNQTRIGKRVAVLVKRNPSTSKKKLFSIYRSNIGLQSKQEQLLDIQRKYRKVTTEEAGHLWKDQYAFSENGCTHAYWRGKCKKKVLGLDCEVGMRKRTCFVLSGSVLSVWTKLEGILSTHPGASGKMQIIRLRLDDGTKIVGALVPANLVELLIRTLSVSKNEPDSILNLL